MLERWCRLLPVPFVLILCGCNSTPDLYPLRMGMEWTYSSSNGFSPRIQEIKVTRRVPVAFTNGFELQGPTGITRLAWRGGTLYADAFPNTRIHNALPILVANDPHASVNWNGTLDTANFNRTATASLNQNPENIQVGTRRYDAIRAVVSLSTGNDNYEMITWYAKGLGPIRQEQRTNGKLDYKVELISGP